MEVVEAMIENERVIKGIGEKDNEAEELDKLKKKIKDCLVDLDMDHKHELIEKITNQSYKVKLKTEQNNRRLIKIIPFLNRNILDILPLVSDENVDLNSQNLNIFPEKSKKPSEMIDILSAIQPILAEFVHSLQNTDHVLTEINKLLNVKKCILRAKFLFMYRFFSFIANSHCGIDVVEVVNKKLRQNESVLHENTVDAEKIKEDDGKNDDVVINDVLKINPCLKSSIGNIKKKFNTGDATLQKNAKNVLKFFFHADFFNKKGFTTQNCPLYLTTWEAYDSSKLINGSLLMKTSRDNKVKILSKPKLQTNIVQYFSGIKRNVSPATNENDPSSNRSMLPFRSSYSPLWFTSINLGLLASFHRPNTLNQHFLTFKNNAFSKPCARLKLKHNQVKVNKKFFVPKNPKPSENSKSKPNEDLPRIDNFSLLDTKNEKPETAEEKQWGKLLQIFSKPCRFILERKNILCASLNNILPNSLVPHHAFKWVVVLNDTPSSIHNTFISKSTPDAKRASNYSEKQLSLCTTSSDSLTFTDFDSTKTSNTVAKKQAKIDKKRKKDSKNTKDIAKDIAKDVAKEVLKYRLVEIEMNDSFENKLRMLQKNERSKIFTSVTSPSSGNQRMSRTNNPKQKKMN